MRAARRAARWAAACAWSAGLPGAFAQPVVAPDPATVVVTVTGVAQPGFDTPAAVDAVSGRTLREGQRQVNLSETLARVPGLHIADRQNYAQDLQISSRGFGARSSFGVRGIRLYADGIPASMPDGSGQVSHFALSSAARVEVLRGPFSALHGNAAGGVIAIFSGDAPAGLTVTPSLSLGSYGTWRLGAQAAGTAGAVGFSLDASRFATDGYRERSAATRELENARLKFALGDATTLTFTANRVDMPASQDALGLTRAEFSSDPRQASPAAVAFNTRKSTRQIQYGAAFEHAFSSANRLRVTGYLGDRSVTQYQAIPAATQTPAAHPGGVIDLARDFGGLDARWIHQGFVGDGAYTVTAGFARETQDELRRGYLNFLGPAAAPSALGVLGAIRRNEANRVVSTARFVQGEWQAWPAIRLSAGVRHTRVAFNSRDLYVAAGNGDDSGAVSYAATTPAAGLVWSIAGELNAYATVGRGFETPTFNELAYRPGGVSGLNFGLKPAVSRHAELGLKARFDGGWANLAVFRAGTTDEIVTLVNAGGRAVFQNAGRTERRGVELVAAKQYASGIGLHLAYTYLDATYRDGFLTCLTTPCAAPVVPVAPGNALPGVPRHSLFAELAWRAPRPGALGQAVAALEVRRVSQVFVDDRNSDAVSGYTVAALRAGLEKRAGDWTVAAFARVDNLADVRYAGSVIVNEANSRFFETAPGRNWTLGATLAYRIRQ